MRGPPVYRSGNITVIQEKGLASFQEEIEQRFLQMLAAEGLFHMKTMAMSGIFKRPTGAYAASLRSRVEGRAVVWWSDVSYAQAIEFGVRPHQMWHLLDKTVPLTLYKNGTEMKIFRKVSLRSLLAGKWLHPGYPGKYIMKHGVETSISRIPELLAKAREAVVQVIPG